MLKRLLASIANGRGGNDPAASGVTLWQRRDLAGAERCFRLAVARDPDRAAHLTNLGLVLWEQHRFDEALRFLVRAVEVEPSHVTARVNLGNAFIFGSRSREGIDQYRAALAIQPQHAKAHANILKPLLDLCEWNAAGAEVALLVERWRAAAADPMVSELSPFASLLVPFPPEFRLAIAQRYATRVAERVASSARPVRTARAPAPRLRVGYLSGDFHDHATAHLMAGLLESHDRGRFELVAYSYGIDDGSTYRARMIRAFDEFVDVRAASFHATAQRIAADGVDILVDCKGYTSESRPEILALRPAPVQVNFLAYPGTMSGRFTDYIVADKVVLPESEVCWFGEKVAWMPVTYQPNDNRQPIAAAPMGRAEFGLPDGHFVYCSFNKHYKIEREIFDAWLAILAAVPGSVLWLLAGAGESNLRRRASDRGVNPERLVFARKLSKPGHLARHRLADLCLDTRFYNGHTTTSDALWAGVPVLTSPGPTFAGRVAESLLCAVGLPELVCPTLADYESTAVALARDPGRLQALKGRMAENRLATPLFDTAGYARALERVYETMWRRHAAGDAPAHLVA